MSSRTVIHESGGLITFDAGTFNPSFDLSQPEDGARRATCRDLGLRGASWFWSPHCRTATAQFCRSTYEVMAPGSLRRNRRRRSFPHGLEAPTAHLRGSQRPAIGPALGVVANGPP